MMMSSSSPTKYASQQILQSYHSELSMESALGTVCKQYAGQQNATAVSLLAHVQGCLLSLVAVAFIDLFLRYATLKEYKTHSKARWFMLHSLVNFWWLVSRFMIQLWY